MKARHGAMLVTGVLLGLIAVWQIGTAARGLEIITIRSTTPPLSLVAPKGDLGSRPLVLIGHGFAGSMVIMRGFAFTLAHAGYAVVLWDFDGHGTNPQPVPTGMGGDALLTSAESALAEAMARGWGDPRRTAILGHSMGSGVALSFGQKHPETAATIAVSPVGTQVTPALPHNLLLMAGSRESRFVQSAEQRLAEAGGAGGDPVAGTARKLVVVPGVEHMSILFSPVAHATARQWLDATFGPQPGARTYTDRRVGWYGLGLLGTLLVAMVFVAAVSARAAHQEPIRALGWRLSTIAGGALGATILLWLAGKAGLGLRTLLGLSVGGYLLIWFGVAGLLSLLILWRRPTWPSRRDLSTGLLAFAALWAGVGLLGQFVWLPWLLIPRRLALWPLGVLLTLPWFLAAGEVVQGAGVVGRVGWWLADCVAVTGCALLALYLSPDLGFLVLILPLFPVVLGLHALVAASTRGRWAFALSGAMFTGWLLLAVFPLQ